MQFGVVDRWATARGRPCVRLVLQKHALCWHTTFFSRRQSWSRRRCCSPSSLPSRQMHPCSDQRCHVAVDRSHQACTREEAATRTTNLAPQQGSQKIAGALTLQQRLACTGRLRPSFLVADLPCPPNRSLACAVCCRRRPARKRAVLSCQPTWQVAVDGAQARCDHGQAGHAEQQDARLHVHQPDQPVLPLGLLGARRLLPAGGGEEGPQRGRGRDRLRQLRRGHLPVLADGRRLDDALRQGMGVHHGHYTRLRLDDPLRRSHHDA
jgi:hypothetical protein